MRGLIKGDSFFKCLICSFLCFFLLLSTVVFSQEKSHKESFQEAGNSFLSDINEAELVKSVRYHINKKEYKKAELFLSNYYEQYSESLEINWLYAHVLSLNGKKDKAVEKFQKAISIAPENKELKKDYTRLLYEIGDVKSVEKTLSSFVNEDATDAEFLLIKANTAYWQGNIKESKNTIDRIKSLYPNTNITDNLSKELDQVTSLYVKANFEYQEDSQPLEYFAEHVELGQYRSKYIHPKLQVSNYNYAPQAEQALIIKLSNQFYMDYLKLKATVTGGAYVNFSGETDWIGGVDFTENFTKDFSLNIGYAKKNLLSTIVSTTYNLTFQDLYGAVDYQNKFFAIHAGYSHQLYAEDNTIQSFVSWLVSQPIKFQKVSFQFGYSYAYSDSKEILFVQNVSTTTIEDGIYNPYFTPNNQTNHAALFMLDYKPTDKLTLSAKVNYGFEASFLNPYFYNTFDLDNLVGSGFYKETSLKPKEITGAVAYNFTNRFGIKATYLYQETFFYDRDNINVGFNYIF